VHIYSPGQRASQGHPRWRVWASCLCFNPRRKGILKRLLLAFDTLGHGRDGQEVWGMPIPCQADSSAGAWAINHPTHLALCYLGARHSRSISSSARGLPLPLHRHRQVCQVGGCKIPSFYQSFEYIFLFHFYWLKNHRDLKLFDYN
jgi:hypothetical protein